MKKRKQGADVPEKVIIVHRSTVPSLAEREGVQKKYPNALVKVVHADDIVKEAIHFKKKVQRIVRMLEVSEHDAREMAALWPGCVVREMDTQDST